MQQKEFDATAKMLCDGRGIPQRSIRVAFSYPAIEDIFRGLHDRSMPARAQATMKLATAMLDPKTKFVATVTAGAKCLCDEDVGVRISGLTALGHAIVKGSDAAFAAIPAIVDMLNETNPSVVETAMQVLKGAAIHGNEQTKNKVTELLPQIIASLKQQKDGPCQTALISFFQGLQNNAPTL